MSGITGSVISKETRWTNSAMNKITTIGKMSTKTGVDHRIGKEGLTHHSYEYANSLSGRVDNESHMIQAINGQRACKGDLTWNVHKDFLKTTNYYLKGFSLPAVNSILQLEAKHWMRFMYHLIDSNRHENFFSVISEIGNKLRLLTFKLHGTKLFISKFGILDDSILLLNTVLSVFQRIRLFESLHERKNGDSRMWDDLVKRVTSLKDDGESVYPGFFDDLEQFSSHTIGSCFSTNLTMRRFQIVGVTSTKKDSTPESGNKHFSSFVDYTGQTKIYPLCPSFQCGTKICEYWYRHTNKPVQLCVLGSDWIIDKIKETLYATKHNFDNDVDFWDAPDLNNEIIRGKYIGKHTSKPLEKDKELSWKEFASQGMIMRFGSKRKIQSGELLTKIHKKTPVDFWIAV